MLQTILAFVMAWYNLPFTILLCICVVLALLQWIGLGGEHDSDADVGAHVDADADADLHLDVHADVDADADADLHLDVGAHADADAGAHADHDVDHGGGESGFSVLAYLGLGRAPLMVILLMLFGSVGLLGWIFNSLLFRGFGTYPGLAFGGVFVAALLGGSVISSRLARMIGRMLPPVSTTATPANALVGRRGTVISPFVDQRYGMVHLRDVGGTLISVFAVTAEGDEPIRRGEEVILVHYFGENRTFEVVRADFA
jgi:membrane protein implicated in regulation of membrane protease activity